MGFQFTALQAKVTVEGISGVPAGDQTIVHSYKNSTGTIYAVPTGKTFYLMGICFANDDAGAQETSISEHGGASILSPVTPTKTTFVVATSCPLHAFTSEQNVLVTLGANCRAYTWGVLV